MVLCNSHHVVHREAVGYPVGSQELEAVVTTCWGSQETLAHGHYLISVLSLCHVIAQLCISDSSRKGWREM